jgi:Cu(I)/Ag(I) efflux system periplasmic protein CusF
MMKHTTAVVLAAAVAFSLGNFPAVAVAHSHDRVPVSAQSASAMADGEVRKIDKDAGKVTIRHGEIKNLDMPAMTMVFRVKEPIMLDRLQPGDKIKFSVEKIGGQFTVTDFEPAK